MSTKDADVIKIAAGVALGVIAAGVIGFFVRLWLIQAAMSNLQETTQKATADIERSMQESMRKQQANLDADRAEAAYREQQQRQALEAQQRAVQEAKVAAMQAAEAKEQA